MGRSRAKYWDMVDAAKQEALLAVDLYNRPIHERSFEAFVVHMHIAWTYLLHAQFERSGVDYRYWNKRGTRLVKVDGEPKTWELSECVKNRWQADDPVRRNLEFFIGLRNKIEHRFDDAVAAAAAGHAQANLLNFDEELAAEFGAVESIADRLRFPVFLKSLTEYGEDTFRALQQRMPRRAKAYMTEFHAGLEEEIRDDQRFQFRLHLIPWLGPKTEADMAIRFVRLDELDEAEREILSGLERTGHVIVRERQQPVRNFDGLSPTTVVEEVQKDLPFVFNMWHFIEAWKYYAVRPAPGSDNPERTDARYCIYDSVHGDYVYTQAFVRMLVRKLSDENTFRQVYGRGPTMVREADQ